MKSKRTVVYGVIAAIFTAFLLIIGGLFLYFRGQCEPYELNIRGVKIAADGEIMEEGKIVIKGTHFKNKGNLHSYVYDVTELKIVDMDQLHLPKKYESYVLSNNAIVLFNECSNLEGKFYTKDNEAVSFGYIHNPKHGWYVLRIEGMPEVYYIGSTLTNTTPSWKTILDDCEEMFPWFFSQGDISPLMAL